MVYVNLWMYTKPNLESKMIFYFRHDLSLSSVILRSILSKIFCVRLWSVRPLHEAEENLRLAEHYYTEIFPQSLARQHM